LSDEDLVPLRWCWYPQTYGSKARLLPSSGGSGVPKDCSPIRCSRKPLYLVGRSRIHISEELEEAPLTVGGGCRVTAQFAGCSTAWQKPPGLGRSGRQMTERCLRQMLQARGFEGTTDEGGRWGIPGCAVYQLLTEQLRKRPESALEIPSSKLWSFRICTIGGHHQNSTRTAPW